MKPLRWPAAIPLAILALALAGCREPAAQALGTLEYDRITVPAPAAERIVSIAVHEGQQVAKGELLLVLETRQATALARAAEEEATRQREVLAELEAGSRPEAVRRAQATLEIRQAQMRDADAYASRVEKLGKRKLVSAVEIDRARAAATAAQAAAREARAALDEVKTGARPEQIAQSKAALGAAEARSEASRTTLDRLELRAPGSGIVDALPYRLGDQAPVGAPLVVMLVGPLPYARIYVPEPLRANVKVGTAVSLSVHGRSGNLPGHVRSIRSEPSFTPYYALTGEDASRLSWLAEVELDEASKGLPAGLPVRVQFELPPDPTP